MIKSKQSIKDKNTSDVFNAMQNVAQKIINKGNTPKNTKSNLLNLLPCFNFVIIERNYFICVMLYRKE